MKLSINYEKTKYMNFGNTALKELTINGHSIQETDTVNFLGITLNNKSDWTPHVQTISNKINRGIAILIKLRHYVDINTLVQVYYSIIHCHISYGIIVWGGVFAKHLDKILKLQKKAIRVMTFKHPMTSCKSSFKQLQILTAPSLYILESCCYIYKKLSEKNNSGHVLKQAKDIHTLGTSLMVLSKTPPE